jgi:hypothetical protein
MKNKNIYYPFFAALYPVLIVYSLNLGEIGFSEIVRSILFSLALAFVALLGFQSLYRDIHKSALVATCIVDFIGNKPNNFV